jgi:L-ribulose-5-phosphate 3-epimerase
MKFVLFTDDIKDLNIREACRGAKAAGFDGLDLTVRPGGHVLPENVKQGLPEAYEIADQEHFAIPMISTGINAADSPHAQEIIEIAHFSISAFKLGYWRYEPFGTIRKQFDEARRKLEGIVRITDRYHLKPCIHVHSGPLLSNTPLIYELLKDYSPDQVGAYVDTMHMVLEGGKSGWEITLDLVAPWISLVAVKNFVIQPTKRDEFGQQRYEHKICPVADGIAPIPQFFQRLKQVGYDGIVSFSSEYRGGDTWQKLKTPEILRQSALDLQHVKSVIAKL